MTDTQETLADLLEEYAVYLELDGQDGRAHAYDKAARSIRRASYIGPDPSNIDGVGDSIRTTIAKWQRSGTIEELDELKEQYSWFEELKDVSHIGPARAEQLHYKLRVDDLDDLLLVARNGDLTLIDGVGPKTAEKIHESAKKQS
jgi:DNA polymerase/3'-5' exonuclease PolX